MYKTSHVYSITEGLFTDFFTLAQIDGLILHSDQGSQFTAFYASVGIKQSMSRAAHPTDNSPIERFFNTLKCEFFYLHDFHSSEILYRAIEDFAYIFYNHVRSHSFNDFNSPFQKRCF
ncbi:MAG: DDE-type integrase/transposase/recombinase [Selenomonadaceae bacterium]|nr:DDE-type integrase/transposase/recombinase [Selenomonadaceae bacterium]